MLVRFSMFCPRLTASRLQLNWSMGHLYTVSGVKRIVHSQELFGRIAELQMTSIHRKNRLRMCHTMKRDSTTGLR